MARATTSVRLDSDLRAQLAAAAAQEGTTVTHLIERFVREGLACAAHPGIVFKSGPSGRRAALAGGPDVWEIASALRHTTGSEAERIALLASAGWREVPYRLDAATERRRASRRSWPSLKTPETLLP
jgi:hypothetical protein